MSSRSWNCRGSWSFLSTDQRATYARTGQWSFPLNVPIEFSGVVQRGRLLRELPVPSLPATDRLYRHFNDLSPTPEWTTDVEYETLGPLRFKSVGTFSETAFFHEATKTLLVTDAVVSVTADPPAIVREDPRAMLFHARDRAEEVVTDDETTRRKGWRRMAQFGLVFFPSRIDVVPLGRALGEARRVTDPVAVASGRDAVPLNLYPWTWRPDDADATNFDAVSDGGRLFCPPILTKLILDREPARTLAWVDRVTERFAFDRVIPGHLNNDVAAGPREFREAFDVLRNGPGTEPRYRQRPLEEDLALLQKASDLLTDLGVVGPSLVCDGEGARTTGRFATASSSSR